MDRILVGRDGERRAVELLRKNGYTILARNYRCRSGEIDIVASHEGEIVFVEVKARGTDEKGTALDAITPAKRRRIARVAEAFLAERGLDERPCRFDVVAIAVHPEESGGQIVRDAFMVER
jgi:putative endonuclease